MSGYKFFDPEYDDFLMHYGVPGQVHGIRNYQFKDGTWTELGKERRRIGNVAGRGRSASESKPNRRYSRKAEEKFIASIRPDVDVINKGHHPLAYGNCGYCSIAYEMRRRGYDEKAPLVSDMFPSDVQKVFRKRFEAFDADPYGVGYCAKTTKGIAKKAGATREETPKKVLDEIYGYSFSKGEIRRMEKELIAQGDGARGIIFNVWSNTGLQSAHYLNYEIAHGSVYQIDSQARIICKGLGKDYLEKSCFAYTMRTDDAKLNEKAFEDLFHKAPTKKSDKLMHSDIGGNMTVTKVVNLFKESFPELEIGELRHISGWYIFTIKNAPKHEVAGMEVSFDPYVGYNTRTNEWESISPRMIGPGKFFGARLIPFE